MFMVRNPHERECQSASEESGKGKCWKCLRRAEAVSGQEKRPPEMGWQTVWLGVFSVAS